MGVRVWRTDGGRDDFGVAGDATWTARRQSDGTLVVAYLRGGRVPEARRLYRRREWARVEVDHGRALDAR